MMVWMRRLLSVVPINVQTYITMEYVLKFFGSEDELNTGDVLMIAKIITVGRRNIRDGFYS